MMIVPLDFRLPSLGLERPSLDWSFSLMEELDEVELMSSGYEGLRWVCSVTEGKGLVVCSVNMAGNGV